MAISLPDNDTIVYKTVRGKELRMTLLPPQSPKYEKAPLYFLIPGGGWHSADRQSTINFSEMSVKALRQIGFAVVSIEYRTVNDRLKISDVIEDCFDALGYLCEHEAELDIDTERVVVSGHSAGAHLALMLAYSDGKIFSKNYDFGNLPLRIISVAALSPATVLYEENYPKTIGFSTDYLFSEPNDLDERKKVSPIEYVDPHCPPTVLFAGGDDPLILCDSSKLLYEKLIANGVKASLVLSENAGHSFEKLSPDKEPTFSFGEIQEKLLDFVTRNLPDEDK